MLQYCLKNSAERYGHKPSCDGYLESVPPQPPDQTAVQYDPSDDCNTGGGLEGTIPREDKFMQGSAAIPHHLPGEGL